MAMLIAWQAVNAARRDSKDFSRAFLIVTPGITIRDRLRVLLPSEPNNYYETRDLVPPDMLPEIRRAEIVITNYHAFQHRDLSGLGKVARSYLQGNAPEPLVTVETDAEMLKRACGKLLAYDRVNVLNDEAHHCYQAQGRGRRGRHADGGSDKKRGRRERGGRPALDQRHRGAGPQAVEECAGNLRPLGHALLPARFGLQRRHAIPLGRVRLQPDGRDRERHRQAAPRACHR